MTGFAYFVGSGCGTIDALTVRGYQLLCQAEVVIYDALIDAELLQYTQSSCLTFNVGKRGGQPSLKQTEIDRLIVEQCQQGKQVVRLKSGDPFIFGRTTSEIQAVKAAQIPYEVVPGISSALAAPLYAGIPLTDLVLSRCFAILSAHDPDALDWATLVNLETLVILMGGRHLATIVEQLIHHDKSSNTAIAIIQWAGRSEERIWTGVLGDIVQITKGESLSPCVMVLGEVVRLREFLATERKQDPLSSTVPLVQNLRAALKPYAASMPQSTEPQSTDPSPLEQRPLADRTVLVTRSAGQSSEFTDLLQAQGATVVEMPTLEITPPSSWDALDREIAQLNTFDWLILTSANAVNYFCDRLLALGRDARAIGQVKIAVVGEKTADCLRSRSLNPDFIPPNFVADSLIEAFPEPVAGFKILFPRVESGGREVLVKEFTAQGATVVEVPAYQSACPAAISPEALQALQSRAVDVITFTSSKTVRHFYQLLEAAIDGSSHALLERVCLASIGPQTSKTCQDLLGRVDVEASEYTLLGLTQALLTWQVTAENPRKV
ncbi:uroporphyrinogen-III C-methyltransferase [Alkalinema pantanalense CENA528]|uniref:uroporphyrinogen-III C-methyltransferase n=1 Tax=Alkalinema pantanalense TaxID=1620705 RepID=UPI003D6E941C